MKNQVNNLTLIRGINKTKNLGNLIKSQSPGAAEELTFALVPVSRKVLEGFFLDFRYDGQTIVKRKL